MRFCVDFSARKSERDGSSHVPQGEQDCQERPDLQPGTLRPTLHTLNPLHLHGCCQQILELCSINSLLPVKKLEMMNIVNKHILIEYCLCLSKSN